MALPLFANDILTIDIGFRYIKILQIKRKKNNSLVVVNFGIGDTPKGCIKNGAINDKERVIAEIKKVMHEQNLDAKEAKIVISGTNIITRIMMIDKVPEEEVDKKAWEEIKESLPINFSEHSVDYKLLGVINENGTEKIKLFVTAVSKKIITSYIDILNSLNLKPVAVDTPANSISKFFQKEVKYEESENWIKKKRRIKSSSSNTYAVIDMGSETTIVNIIKDKSPEFNRVLLMGGSNIDNAIARTLELEQRHMDKAERYKKMYGIAVKDPNNELENTCCKTAKAVVDEIIKNIKVCFDFYQNRCAGETVSRIYTIGGGSMLKGLGDYMEQTLDVPVYPINALTIDGIEFVQGLNLEKINYLINAIGVSF
ncbi:MAG: pilus assembly protein PilM [Bacillota bacterium]|nr:pilus assembly protein PilM [Bacillota bacterium]